MDRRATTTSFAMLLGLAFCASATADGLWTEVDVAAIAAPLANERTITPHAYRVFTLDDAALRGLLADAPMEPTASAEASPSLIALPMPDGRLRWFAFSESPVMEPALAARFPGIRTYKGQGVDDPADFARFDVTYAGFHAMVLSPSGDVFIDPLHRGASGAYQSYFRREYRNDAMRSACLADADAGSAPGAVRAALGTSVAMRRYRLAMATTGEYTQFYGGTVALGQSAVATTVNRINLLYERDLAIRFVLVANNSSLIFTNAITDPYTNTDPATALAQNQTTLTNVIGGANYDIGHVLATATGGLASVASVCVGASKARGTSGIVSPNGDPFDIDFVAHELGHQLGADHTFNGSVGSCLGNRSTDHAYEVGSGSTVMGYAGRCASQDLQVDSDDYFHRESIDQIAANLAGTGSCASAIATTNQAPTVEAGAAFTIPSRTPFALTASGSDPDGDALTWTWEQFNLGPAGASTTDNGSSPILRSFPPSASATRLFPKLSDILAGTTTYGELLPTTTRTLVFRVTARDNNVQGGGTAVDATTVTSIAGAGPFQVTSPNAATTWSPGTTQSITWNVAGTTGNGIDTANVRISFSVDNGATFPITLAASTANDGTASITVPNVATTNGRIKVEAVGNIFFDIGNGAIAIASPTIFANGFESGVP